MPGVPGSAVDNRDVPDPRQLYHKWHATTPVVTRAIVTLLAVISVSNTLSLSSLSPVLTCVPLFTLQHLELWRLFTCHFFANGFLSLLFQSFALNYVAKKLERALGSVHFALLTLLFCLSISTLFVILCVTVSHNPIKTYPAAMLFQGEGLWGVILAFTVIECSLYPHPQRKLFMLPWNIPTAYYPFALLVVLSFFGGFSFFIPLGYVLGHVINRSTIPLLTLQHLEAGTEDSIVSYLLSSRSGYISVDAAVGGLAYESESEGSSSSGAAETLERGGRTLGSTEGAKDGGGQVLGTFHPSHVPSAVDEFFPRDDPSEAAALAAERRLERQQRYDK